MNVIGLDYTGGRVHGIPWSGRPRMAASSDGKSCGSCVRGVRNDLPERGDHDARIDLDEPDRSRAGRDDVVHHGSTRTPQAASIPSPTPGASSRRSPPPASSTPARASAPWPWPIGSGAAIDVQVAGRGGVPDDGVAAVVLNVTVTEPTGWGYLSVYPSGGPTVSNLNFTPGQTVANMATVALGTGGRLQAFNAVDTTHVIFDVVGYYADADGPFGSRFVPVVPLVRVRHTNRAGRRCAECGRAWRCAALRRHRSSGRAGGGRHLVVVVNLTATAPTANTYLTAYPDDAPRPLVSSLNLPAGWTVPNLVTVRVPASGIVDVYNVVGFDARAGRRDGARRDRARDERRSVRRDPRRAARTTAASPWTSPTPTESSRPGVCSP